MNTDSLLVTYTKQSPNRTAPRNQKIDRITPHVYVGQVSIESMAGWLCTPQAKASANYGIAADGKIGQFVLEKDRSWCSSSATNDNRAVTIECASDVADPYAINKTVESKLLDLMTDICKRNGKKKLLWLKDKDKTLAYEPKADEMVLSVHRWFANKACPGGYIMARMAKYAEEVTKRLSVKEEIETYTPEEWIAMIAPIAQEMSKIFNIIASVLIAQTALETGWGLTDLTQKYNIIGMKADLINSTWQEHSVWKGQTYTKVTPEYRNGVLTYVEDVFRVYNTFRECLVDYCNFLLYVRNDKGYKYRRIQGKTDPKDVIRIIRIGTGTDKNPEGYCTDPNYEKKILSLIDQYNLREYDIDAVSKVYRVQVGAYTQRKNAIDRKAKVQELTKMDCFIEKTDLYRVYCGSFKSAQNAGKRLDELAEYKISGFIVGGA